MDEVNWGSEWFWTLQTWDDLREERLLTIKCSCLCGCIFELSPISFRQVIVSGVERSGSTSASRTGTIRVCIYAWQMNTWHECWVTVYATPPRISIHRSSQCGKPMLSTILTVYSIYPVTIQIHSNRSLSDDLSMGILPCSSLSSNWFWTMAWPFFNIMRRSGDLRNSYYFFQSGEESKLACQMQIFLNIFGYPEINSPLPEYQKGKSNP